MHLNFRGQRLSAGDVSIVLGMALLLFGIGGLYVDTTTASARSLTGREESVGKVVRRVYHPPAPATPLPQAALALPTLAPFTPAAQTPGAANRTQPTAAPGSTARPEATAAPGEQVKNNAFLAPGTPAPTAVPLPQALAPQRIVIPAIHLDAPVVPSGYALVNIEGQIYQQWEAPDEYAAGWQQTSAYLGVPGNTVLNGHNNIYGSVFARLNDLNEGDSIAIYSGDWVISYTITNKMILPERGQDLSVRLDNGRWMQPTTDERLTLVSCWPLDSNTDRLFIVAAPVEKRLASGGQSP